MWASPIAREWNPEAARMHPLVLTYIAFAKKSHNFLLDTNLFSKKNIDRNPTPPVSPVSIGLRRGHIDSFPIAFHLSYMYRVRMHTPSFPSLFPPKYVHNASSVSGGKWREEGQCRLNCSPLLDCGCRKGPSQEY